ncbi:unnamed protein product [Musa acuminata subsp. burmannicoides]
MLARPLMTSDTREVSSPKPMVLKRTGAKNMMTLMPVSCWKEGGYEDDHSEKRCSALLASSSLWSSSYPPAPAGCWTRGAPRSWPPRWPPPGRHTRPGCRRCRGGSCGAWHCLPRRSRAR